MCSPASFVVTKSKVFWSEKSDSHEDIIAEFNLEKLDDANRMGIVRVEITPPNSNDFDKPLSEWAYRVDQDILPEWYDAVECEERTRRSLEKWLAYKVILPGVEVETLDRCVLALYGKVGEMWGSAQVGEMCGSAQVGEMCGSAQVREMCGSAQVREMCGSAQVRVMRESAQVGEMWGSAQVGEVNEYVTVSLRSKNATVEKINGDMAAVLDRTGNKVILITS